MDLFVMSNVNTTVLLTNKFEQRIPTAHVFLPVKRFFTSKESGEHLMRSSGPYK